MSINTNLQSESNSVLTKFDAVLRQSKELEVQSKALSTMYIVIAAGLLVFMVARVHYSSDLIKSRIVAKNLDIQEKALKKSINQKENNTESTGIESSSNNNNATTLEAHSFSELITSINKIFIIHSLLMGISGIACGAAIIEARKWAC